MSAALSEDYLARFGGLARLYGRAALERFQAAHVCVVGVGGVGSWTVEALARTGIGALTLIDLDDVCITNVNRQLPAMDGTIGRPKVDVLADRVLTINPACRVNRVAEFFTAGSVEELLGAAGGEARFSFVVDAIDKLGNKALLIASCFQRGLPIVTMGGAGGKRDGTQVRVGDLAQTGQDELLRQVRRSLRRDYGFGAGRRTSNPAEQIPFGIPAVFSMEKPMYPWADGTCSAEREPGSSTVLDCATGFGSACHVTAAFGMAAAGEVIRQLAGIA